MSKNGFEPSTAMVLFQGKKTKAQILPREALREGKRYQGPAIITEYSATTVVPPGFGFVRDKAGNIVIKVADGGNRKSR